MASEDDPGLRVQTLQALEKLLTNGVRMNLHFDVSTNALSLHSLVYVRFRTPLLSEWLRL